MERHRLAPGEILVCFTDGVTEAQDPRGGLFDRDRAMAVLANAPGQPLSDVVDGLVSAIRDFEAGSEPSDDLTVLAVRRRG